MKRKSIIKLVAIALTLPMLAIGGYALSLKARQASAGYPCYGPNIVYCGTNSKQDLVNMLHGTDQAGHGDIKTIYDKIGIYENDIQSSRFVDGFLRKDGTVIVNGQGVAWNTVNGQRGAEGINGAHTPWIGLEWASPSANFRRDINGLDVWVYMQNGQFKYAVIKACGNPVLVPPLHEIPTNITVSKQVENLTNDKVWRKENVADPGNALGYIILVKNVSDVSVRDIVIKDILPPHMDLIPGTGVLSYGGLESKITDASITGGGHLGVMPPGQEVSVRFATRVHPKEDFPGGCINLVNTGIAKAGNTPQVQDTASTKVCVVTPQAKFNITVKKFNDLNGDGQKEDNEPLLPDWTFTLKGTSLEDTRITDATGSINYANLDEGSYTITEQMQPSWRSTTGVTQTVTIGPDKTVMFGNQQITPPPTTPPTVTPSKPTQLPTAGPVDVAAGVLGTIGIGYVAFAWKKSKKSLMKNLKKS